MRNYSSINESNHTVPTESTFHSLSNVSTIRVRTNTRSRKKKKKKRYLIDLSQ